MMSAASATNRLQSLQALLQGDDEVTKTAKIRQSITKLQQLVVNREELARLQHGENTVAKKATLKA